MRQFFLDLAEILFIFICMWVGAIGLFKVFGLAPVRGWEWRVVLAPLIGFASLFGAGYLVTTAIREFVHRQPTPTPA